MAVALIGIAMAMLASYPLGRFMPTAWLKPLVCVFFLAIVLGRFWRETHGAVGSQFDPAAFGVTAAGGLDHANRPIGVL